MTDLNFPIEGKTPGQLARYFDCPAELIIKAIESGATTYQDVHDYLEKHK